LRNALGIRRADHEIAQGDVQVPDLQAADLHHNGGRPGQHFPDLRAGTTGFVEPFTEILPGVCHLQITLLGVTQNNLRYGRAALIEVVQNLVLARLAVAVGKALLKSDFHARSCDQSNRTMTKAVEMSS
jgi:hypothetical protein